LLIGGGLLIQGIVSGRMVGSNSTKGRVSAQGDPAEFGRAIDMNIGTAVAGLIFLGTALSLW
jgi:hypothetical protein